MDNKNNSETFIGVDPTGLRLASDMEDCVQPGDVGATIRKRETREHEYMSKAYRLIKKLEEDEVEERRLLKEKKEQQLIAYQKIIGFVIWWENFKKKFDFGRKTK